MGLLVIGKAQEMLQMKDKAQEDCSRHSSQGAKRERVGREGRKDTMLP